MTRVERVAATVRIPAFAGMTARRGSGNDGAGMAGELGGGARRASPSPANEETAVLARGKKKSPAPGPGFHQLAGWWRRGRVELPVQKTVRLRRLQA